MGKKQFLKISTSLQMNSGHELWNMMKWQVTKKLGKTSFILLSSVYSLILLIRPTILFLFFKKRTHISWPITNSFGTLGMKFQSLVGTALGIWLLHLGPTLHESSFPRQISWKFLPLVKNPQSFLSQIERIGQITYSKGRREASFHPFVSSFIHPFIYPVIHPSRHGLFIPMRRKKSGTQMRCGGE